MSTTLRDEELINQAELLHEESRQILDKNSLLSCFDDNMSPTVVGSVVTDLMTKPDIDIICCLEPLQLDSLFMVGERIVAALSVGRLTYINPSVVPWHEYYKGLFCGVKFRSDSGRIWSIDIWAYNRGDFEAAMQEHNALAAKLDKLNRLMLLRIKSAFDGQSYIVYKAMLEHGVESVEDFRSFLEVTTG